MEYKQTKIKLVSSILGGLVLLILLLATISSSRENKRLKRAINANNGKIEFLEAQKAPILRKIKSDSVLILKKDSIIITLKVKEEALNNAIKYYKNENKRIKNDYINRSIDERVAIFAELATRTDKSQ